MKAGLSHMAGASDSRVVITKAVLDSEVIFGFLISVDLVENRLLGTFGAENT